MRIALFCTNFYPTPPRRSEKMIYAPLWLTHYLAEGLVKKGHKVFLFGSSDTKTSATLISENIPSIRRNKKWLSAYSKSDKTWKEIMKTNYEFSLLVKMYEMAKEDKFDIIQLHSRINALHIAPFVQKPICFTYHNPFNYPVETSSSKLIFKFLQNNISTNVHFISLSNAQRKPLPDLNYAATVYNGTDIKRFSFNDKRGNYLAFAGRILPQKGIHIAIRVAEKTGKKLKIAGEIPRDHLDYWNTKVKPHLSKKITYEGMLDQDQMVKFYQKAEALIHPTLLEESFGLVLTEAMACGTPAIAFNRGAIPEVIKNNKTGYVVKNQAEMIKAVKKIDEIKKEDCRKWVEKNFTIEKMIDNYEKVYHKILKKKKR